MGNLIAAFVVGKENVTRITRAYPLSDENLAHLRAIVATKAAGRTYYVMLVEDRLWKKRPGKDPLFYWHVGEGFTHEEGWWVDYE